MNIDYQHSQAGWVIRVAIGWGILISLISPIRVALVRDALPSLVGLAPAGLLLVVLLLFHNLTVRMDSERLRVSFGIGLIRYRFLIRDIQSFAPSKSAWHTGWGIRKIQHGWLLNVSGFESVEIVLRNGRVYRIGTDDQKGLLEAIESALHQST